MEERVQWRLTFNGLYGFIPDDRALHDGRCVTSMNKDVTLSQAHSRFNRFNTGNLCSNITRGIDA